MYQINKVRAHNVIDFAAEELKKYLRTMMPGCGDIPITYAPDATEGFRLGLLEDFSLPCEAPNPDWDDVVHIDTTETGGILAGSNPRSVLFAVYRFLRLNGCRFLFPGIDGEHIPCKSVEPQKYHKMADYRLRGHTTEGEPSAEHVLDYIDYHAKHELNYYGLMGIFTYHDRYYRHWQNQGSRVPEPIDRTQTEQWKGMFEAELLKRGMILADGNHDFLIETIGLDYQDRDLYKSGEKQVTEEQRSHFAMLNGKRDLYKNDIMFTQFCMSDAAWRSSYVKLLADFMEKNQHIGTMQVSLADGHHNHCECEKCTKKRPTDWMVMILNELDEEMTRRNLNTRLIFSIYVDQMFPPIEERVKNPDRFYLSWAPITRSYSSSITEDTVFPEAKPYVYNKWETPLTVEECAAHLKEWQKVFPGECRIFEYHYWMAQFLDPGRMAISRRIYEDVRALKLLNISASIEDGSNVSFFPNGFHSYIYGETMTNRDCDYEEELADYFRHCYGDDWKKVRKYLDGISEAFGEKWMNGEDSADPEMGQCYNPAHVQSLMKVRELAATARALAASHPTMPTRPQTVCYRLLKYHADISERQAEIFIEKCQGNENTAQELLQKFIKDYGYLDQLLERYLEFGMLIRATKRILKRKGSKIVQE